MDKERTAARKFLIDELNNDAYEVKDPEGGDPITAMDPMAVWYDDATGKLVVQFVFNGTRNKDDPAWKKLAEKAMQALKRAKPDLVPKQGYELKFSVD